MIGVEAGALRLFRTQPSACRLHSHNRADAPDVASSLKSSTVCTEPLRVRQGRFVMMRPKRPQFTSRKCQFALL